MSRTRQQRSTSLRLPPSIQQELGIAHDGHGAKALPRGQIAERKQHRQKARKNHLHDKIEDCGQNARRNTRVLKSDVELEVKESALLSREQTTVSTRPKPRDVTKDDRGTRVPERVTNSPHYPIVSGSDEDLDGESLREPSSSLVLDASSRTFRDNAAQEDAEIARLEKRLGFKKRKARSMGDETLDFLVAGLEDDGGEGHQARDWFDAKRRKGDHTHLQLDERGPDEGDVSDLSGKASSSQSEVTEELSRDTDDEVDSTGHEEEEFADFDADTRNRVTSKRRENPYVAPVAYQASSTKYMPPSLRKRSEAEDQTVERLKKQIQGQLNKLSEANIVTIVDEVEKLFSANSRQDVTSVLIDLILATVSSRSELRNTFIILHAAFLTAIYKVIGTEFGAETLVRLIDRLDQQYHGAAQGKEVVNLVGLMANLFILGMISSHIVYEHIKLLFSDFTEANAEVLLRLVRDCGPQLRAHDPTALKDIVHILQAKREDIQRSGQKLNVRTQFMIDAIMDLKNNKPRHNAHGANSTGEHIVRMRKALGSLNARNLKATEPLRITREDIVNSDRQGKWWLVGASWRGNGVVAPIKKNVLPDHDNTGMDGVEELGSDDDDVDMLALAKHYRMNTDVRRSIFVAIMSAHDFEDARMRLSKLRLSAKQREEIPKVLLRCARAEQSYNPYYALVANDFCKLHHRARIGFQFSLWNFFGQMGGTSGTEDDDAADSHEAVELHEVVNIAKMFSSLILGGQLTLGVLKVLNIGFMTDRATIFLEVLLISLLLEPEAVEANLLKVFGQTASTPQVVQPLLYFLKRLTRSDLVPETDRGQVRRGVKTAQRALNMVAVS